MTILAQLQVTPAANRRHRPRRKLSLGSSLQGTGEDVTIHDLSSTGMLIETASQLAAFDGLEIELPEAGTTQALVIWSSGSYYGCEFKHPLSQASVSAAQLRSTPIESVALAFPPRPEPAIGPAAEGPRIEDPETPIAISEEKAPLAVRLRVIFGSAIILWAIIIWTAAWLFKIVSDRLH